MAVITESWFRPNVPDYARSIDGYELFAKSRSDIANITDRGGGVAVCVKSQITASDIPEILVPNDLECVWTLVQPKRLPRDTSVIAVCGVYIPRDSPPPSRSPQATFVRIHGPSEHQISRHWLRYYGRL